MSFALAPPLSPWACVGPFVVFPEGGVQSETLKRITKRTVTPVNPGLNVALEGALGAAFGKSRLGLESKRENLYLPTKAAVREGVGAYLR